VVGLKAEAVAASVARPIDAEIVCDPAKRLNPR
jgi:hypothetical protein